MRRAPHNSHTRRAFTIIEILIAVLIIGILTSVLVPVLINRTEEARLAACTDELQKIADAEDQIGIQLGYYVRLFALDDLPRAGDGIGLGGTTPDDIRDAFADEHLNTFYSIPKELFFFTNTAERLPQTQAEALYDTLSDNDALKWTGPYYNIQRDETVDEHDDDADNEVLPTHLHDIPNDPWGNDYVLILRLRDSTSGELHPAVVVEPDGTVTRTPDGDRSDSDTPRAYEITEAIDRPAILSLGPDGLPGDGADPTNTKLGEGDDIYRTFGY